MVGGELFSGLAVVALTTGVGAEVAVVEPAAFRARTAKRIVRPTSALLRT
jgi:hypothetical protein